MPYKPPSVIKGTVKPHKDLYSRLDQQLFNYDDIYEKIHSDNFNPAWRTLDSPVLQDTGTMRRALSFENNYIRRRRVPRIRLPPISNSDLGDSHRQDRRTRNRFAQAYADKGLLYKTTLSTSLPDLPSLSKPQGQPVKFEKLSYSKRIQEEQAPAPSGNRHVVCPTPGPTSQFKLPSIQAESNLNMTQGKHTKKKQDVTDADVFSIVNTTNRTVEYYEHDGRIYVSDNNQSWKDDCACQLCKRNKKEYFDSKRKVEEKRLRRMKNTLTLRDQHASPVKEE